MPLSRSVHRGLLDHLFMGTAFTQPTNIFVGLSSTEPTSQGGNVTEPTTGSYARVSTDGADWDAATDADPAVVTNGEVVEFPQATAEWLAGADLTHFVLYDAAAAGTYLGSGELAVPKAIASGDTASFAVGELEAEMGAYDDTFAEGA